MEGSSLVVQKDARPVERALSLGALIGAPALIAYSLRTGLRGDTFVECVFALIGGLWALHHLLARDQIVVNRESRRVERHSRFLWSASRTEAAFEQLTRVEVRSHHRAPDEVVLQGAQPGRAIVLARSHDRDEVLELARAASRVLGGGLQVDGGHTRSVDERLSAAPLRETQPSPPMGSHIRVARESGVLTMTLPARGWRPLYVAQAGIATLVGVAGPILFGWAWARSQGWTSANVLKPAVGCLLLFVCGSYLL